MSLTIYFQLSSPTGMEAVIPQLLLLLIPGLPVALNLHRLASWGTFSFGSVGGGGGGSGFPLPHSKLTEGDDEPHVIFDGLLRNKV